MQCMSVFSRGSDEWAVGERYDREFHPFLPREIQIYMLTRFLWENIRFSRTTRYAPNHRLAKQINTNKTHAPTGTLSPDSIAAVGNAIVMQCIWGFKVMQYKSYQAVAKHWGSVLTNLPTSPCPNIFLSQPTMTTRQDENTAGTFQLQNLVRAGNIRRSLRVPRRFHAERREEQERRYGALTSDVLDNIERLLRDVRAKGAKLDKERKALASKEKEASLTLEKLKEFEKFLQKR